MKLILLAAGRGTRMGELTLAKPKALVNYTWDRRILESTLLSFQTRTMSSGAIIVGGYKWEAIEQFLGQLKWHIATHLVVNSSYESAGPILSAKLGLEQVNGDHFGLANGDTLYSDEIFRAIESTIADGVFLVCSKVSLISTDDLKVEINESSNTIYAANKALYEGASGIISAGFLLIRGKIAADALRKAIDNRCEYETKNQNMRPWHDIINDLFCEGVPVRPLLVQRCHWWEFDSESDIESYNNYQNKDKLSSYCDL